MIDERPTDPTADPVGAGAGGGAGEGIHEPVGRSIQLELRRAVLDHATSERRRTHPPLVHVGRPGEVEAVWAASDSAEDHSLRTDVIAALLARTRRPGSVPLVWLTRTGELDLQDVDAAWLAAARSAYAEADTQLALVVVNRHGWRDPRTGVGREWRRLRHR